ncbi:MAG: hypothetical protein QOF86_2803, partial [Baekduia sp.]|nr:hypothetical protein [Baekduia sp.]
MLGGTAAVVVLAGVVAFAVVALGQRSDNEKRQAR